MTIKEVEERTGIVRSSIRFYEKENLIQPARNANGYRDYTEQDVQDIKKIAYLRTLGISLERIHQIKDHKISLRNTIENQAQLLDRQIKDLENAKAICLRMLAEDKISYDTLDVEAYEPELPQYWNNHKKIFKADSVSFLYLWGGSLIWGIIAALCMLTALLIYPYLPKQIPVQWNNGNVRSEVGKLFIFAYPAACIIIRFLLRPFIERWLSSHFNRRGAVSDYVTNYLCFIALSLEIFTILFVYGMATHVTTVLFVDTAVLIGILLVAWKKL